MALYLLGFWLGANLICFALFGWDKRCARNGAWRVPERILLLWSLFGGSLGAKLAQRYFRHKTRKQPFARLLNVICVLHLAMITLAVAQLL